MNDSAGWVMPGGSPHPLHTCLISVHSCQSLLAMRRVRSTTTVLYRRMCRLSPRQTPTVPPGGRVGVYDSCTSRPRDTVTSLPRPSTTVTSSDTWRSWMPPTRRAFEQDREEPIFPTD